MDNTVILALIALATVFVTGTVAPLAVGYFQFRLGRAERAENDRRRTEDNARQDTIAAKATEVAAQAREAARLLAKRQDEIAAQAAEAARLLVEQQNASTAKAAEAASLLLASNERVAANAESTNDKLGAIKATGDLVHSLVNSNLTASKQSELDATITTLALTQEIISLKGVAGQQPSADTLAAVEILKKRISELKTEIVDRKKVS
jgi:hypothetical protein